MWKKIIATLLIIAGLGLFGTSLYITKQIEEGSLKVKKAEKTIRKGEQLFSLTPVTKEVGKELAGSAQKKVDEGKDLITHYTSVAKQLKIVGVVLFIAGIAIFFLPKTRRR